ncbi:MAG: hypothetical protein M3R02_06840 [Chloroflexota bacterium]|nr:hypothetical protein [Chloroflexota bacterium]
MSPSSEQRRSRAEEVIARELARLAEANGGTLPRGSANRVYEALRAEGVGIRRQDVLRLVGEYADFLRIPGAASRPAPERFAPARSEAAKAAKRAAALDVVALMRRDNLSLAEAVRRHNRERPDARVSADSVKRAVPRSLEKRGGAWRPTAHDRYARSSDAITTRGVVRVTVRDSRTASLIARHHNAVDAFLRGDADVSVLRPFRGKRFRAGKQTYVLETDPATLERLALGGEFDDLVIGSAQEVTT